MLIPRGEGVQRISAHTFIGNVFQCSKPICLAIGSHKTNFVFTPDSIFNRPGVAEANTFFIDSLSHSINNSLGHHFPPNLQNINSPEP